MVNRTPEGPEVFGALQAALDRARGTLVECQSEDDRLDARMRELLAERGEALLKLAGHYLPEISRSAIESTFQGIRADLLAILDRREVKRAGLKAEIDRAAVDARRRAEEIDGVTRTLNEKVALREQLEAKVAETLKGHADFQERSGLALQAEQTLHRDERRVEELARESAAKLPQYERSRLFRYLRDRGYATSEYRSGDWVRSIDRRVADLIDYPLAKVGYEFLKETPALVAAEVSRRRDRFTELMRQVEAIEKIEADKAGLTAVLEAGDALGRERDRLVGESSRLQQEAQRLRQELIGLDQAQGEFYRQAIERFRSFLGETRLAMLQERARQTPETVDDAIVAEVARLDGQIDAIGPKLADLADRRKAADRIQQGLDRVVRKYREANYDSDRGLFESFDHRGELARFEEGAIDADDLWRAIQSAQKFRPSWVQETTSTGLEMASSPAGRVILNALLHIAGAALQEAAYRGVRRRSDASPRNFPPPAGGGPGRPSRPSNPSSEGGFTTGEGF